MKLGLGLSLGSGSRPLRLPRAGLLAYIKLVGGELVDTIGVSDITLTAGDVSDLMSASWAFPDNADTRQVDTLLGGDALFDSLNAMAPFTRYGYDWAALDNVDYLYAGYGGIAVYNVSQSAKLNTIIRVLSLPTMMADTLIMLDTLRMVR